MIPIPLTDRNKAFNYSNLSYKPQAIWKVAEKFYFFYFYFFGKLQHTILLLLSGHVSDLNHLVNLESIFPR